MNVAQIRFFLLALSLSLLAVGCPDDADNDGDTDAAAEDAGTDSGNDPEPDADTPDPDADADTPMPDGDADTPDPDADADTPDPDAMVTPPGGCDEVVRPDGQMGAECGDVVFDGEVLFNCGTCDAPDVCDEATNTCGCEPKTCEDLGAECGVDVDDGCGGTIDFCGTADGTCPGQGECSSELACECVPLNFAQACTDQGFACNPEGNLVSDGCDGTIDCESDGGACTNDGESCNAAGQCACTTGSCPSGRTCGAGTSLCECLPDVDSAARDTLCQGKCGTINVNGCLFTCDGCPACVNPTDDCTACSCVDDNGADDVVPVCAANNQCCTPDSCFVDITGGTRKRCNTTGDDGCGSPLGCTCDGNDVCVDADFIVDSDQALCYAPNIGKQAGLYYARINSFVGTATPPVTRADALSLVQVTVNKDGDQLEMTDFGCAATTISQQYNVDNSLASDALISVAPSYINLAPPVITRAAPAPSDTLGTWTRDNLPNTSGGASTPATGGTPVGWEPSPGFCQGFEGTMVTPTGDDAAARPWLAGGACACPAEADEADIPAQDQFVIGTDTPGTDGDVTDCRVIDADDDGRPGWTLYATTGPLAIFTTRLVTRSGARWTGPVADDRRHTGLLTELDDTTKVRTVVSCVDDGNFDACGNTVSADDWSCGAEFNVIQFVPATAGASCEQFYAPDSGPTSCTGNADCVLGPCLANVCNEVNEVFITSTFGGVGTCEGGCPAGSVCSNNTCRPLTTANTCSGDGNATCPAGWACGTDGACWPAACDEPVVD